MAMGGGGGRWGAGGGGRGGGGGGGGMTNRPGIDGSRSRSSKLSISRTVVLDGRAL